LAHRAGLHDETGKENYGEYFGHGKGGPASFGVVLGH